MNNQTMKDVFGKLDKKYCDYFYILSIFGFAMLVLLVLSSLYVGLMKKKGIDFYMNVFGIALGYFVIYFQNRLLSIF